MCNTQATAGGPARDTYLCSPEQKGLEDSRQV
jgi:hypothetical protein